MDRTTYMREYMRSYRARKKTERPKVNPHAACDSQIAHLKAEVAKLTKELDRYRKVDW